MWDVSTTEKLERLERLHVVSMHLSQLDAQILQGEACGRGAPVPDVKLVKLQPCNNF